MTTEIRTIVLMALLALVEALQVLILVVTVFHFIPIPPADLVKDIFPVNQPSIKPEREIFFLQAFVAASILIYSAGLWLLRRDLSQGSKHPALVRLILVDSWWLFVQLFAVFKILMYGGQLRWAQGMFYAALGASLLSRLFWVELDVFVSKFPAYVARWAKHGGLRTAADAIVLAGMGLSLWVIDAQRVWAIIDLWGNRALADQSWISLSPLIKGISYEQSLPWLAVGSIFYYTLFYVFLRLLTGRILLPACGLFLAVKWQFFHAGVAPVIWQFPAKTLVPVAPDIFFWFCLLAHARRPKQKWWLTLGAGVCGFYLAYHFSTGIWAWMAWAVYIKVPLPLREGLGEGVIGQTVDSHTPLPNPPRKGEGKWIAWVFLPWVVFFVLGALVYGVEGSAGLAHSQWTAMLVALRGPSPVPFYDCLRGRYFFAFAAQFLIPVVYCVTFSAADFYKSDGTARLIKAVCVYGLGLFTIHVLVPTVNNYYSVSAALVMVLCFWADRLMGLLPSGRGVWLAFILVFLYAGALFTNNLFGIYPNIWNVSGVHWQR